MEENIPPRLQCVSLQNVFIQLSKEMDKKKKDLNVNNPKSVYGKAIKAVTKVESNKDERSYIYRKWTEHTMVKFTHICKH